MYFQTTLTQKGNDYEYKQEYLIVAGNIGEAEQKSHRFAADWFEGERGEYSADNDCWYFDDEGNSKILVSVTSPVETTLEKFLVHIKSLFVIE